MNPVTKRHKEIIKLAEEFKNWWTVNNEKVLNQNATLDRFITENWPTADEENLPFLLASLLLSASKVLVAMAVPFGLPEYLMGAVFESYNGQVTAYAKKQFDNTVQKLKDAQKNEKHKATDNS